MFLPVPHIKPSSSDCFPSSRLLFLPPRVFPLAPWHHKLPVQTFAGMNNGASGQFFEAPGIFEAKIVLVKLRECLLHNVSHSHTETRISLF